MRSSEFLIVLVFYNFILLLSCVSSASGIKIYPVYESGNFVKAEYLRAAELKCGVEDAPANSTVRWFKDEKLIEASEKYSIAGNKLTISPVGTDDGGTYQCRLVPAGSPPNVTPLAHTAVDVKVFPYIRILEKDQTVIEEDPLNVTCIVKGPLLDVKWSYKNESNVTMERSNAKYFPNDEGVKNARLHIEKANKTDRGYYTCYIELEGHRKESESRVRVKGKYAALWPFLGICAEVFILCTVIFIYEKRRDKTELEESDTDQGPETKSSPDHAADSVRHRK